MTNFSTFSTDVPTFSKKSILLDGVDDYVDVSSFSALFWVVSLQSMWLKFTDKWLQQDIAMNLGSDNWGFFIQILEKLLSFLKILLALLNL